MKMRMSHIAHQVLLKKEGGEEEKKKKKKIVTLLEILLEAVTCRALFPPTLGPPWRTFHGG